ncbi:hypothetical protein PAPHI01_2524 [Pancytospora philotis]|nr:hypothetical protein PAPHI01_2524 [Pancytospora philotis]
MIGRVLLAGAGIACASIPSSTKLLPSRQFQEQDVLSGCVPHCHAIISSAEEVEALLIDAYDNVKLHCEAVIEYSKDFETSRAYDSIRRSGDWAATRGQALLQLQAEAKATKGLLVEATSELHILHIEIYRYYKRIVDYARPPESLVGRRCGQPKIDASIEKFSFKRQRRAVQHLNSSLETLIFDLSFGCRALPRDTIDEPRARFISSHADTLSCYRMLGSSIMSANDRIIDLLGKVSYALKLLFKVAKQDDTHAAPGNSGGEQSASMMAELKKVCGEILDGCATFESVMEDYYRSYQEYHQCLTNNNTA